MGPQHNDSARIASHSHPFRLQKASTNFSVGRYLPAALLANLVPTLEWLLCSVTGLRAINHPILLALPLLYSSLLAVIRTPTTPQKGEPIPTKTNQFLEALSISFFPLVYFYGGLFYTDVGGLILVLGSYRAALSDRWILSASVSASYPPPIHCEGGTDDLVIRSERFRCYSVKPTSSGSDSLLHQLSSVVWS